VFFCHAGFRSHQIAHFLATQMNYTNVAHMAGGIDDWSVRVDPAVPRY
jgi:rhodanese-related sulfurtransferase